MSCHRGDTLTNWRSQFFQGPVKLIKKIPKLAQRLSHVHMQTEPLALGTAQPRLQQAPHAGKIAVKSGQILDGMLVDLARGVVAQSCLAQIGRCSQAGLSGMLTQPGMFFPRHPHHNDLAPAPVFAPRTSLRRVFHLASTPVSSPPGRRRARPARVVPLSAGFSTCLILSLIQGRFAADLYHGRMQFRNNASKVRTNWQEVHLSW